MGALIIQADAAANAPPASPRQRGKLLGVRLSRFPVSSLYLFGYIVSTCARHQTGDDEPEARAEREHAQ